MCYIFFATVYFESLRKVQTTLKILFEVYLILGISFGQIIHNAIIGMFVHNIIFDY